MYLLSIMPNGFKGLTLPENESYADYGCLLWDGAKGDTWKPPTLEWLNDEFTNESDCVGDFTSFGGGPMAVSERAYEVLAPLFSDQVEFLPTRGPNKTDNWRLLNVINILDLLVPEKSIYEVYDDGTVGMCQHGFINTPPANNFIFEVQDYSPFIFINEETKQHIETAGLTGALIREYINPKP